MNIGVTVCICNLFIIDFREPVVGCNCTGVGKNKSTNGISNCGILLNTPVFNFNVGVDNILVVKDSGFHLTHFLSLLTIENICFGNVCVTGLLENLLNAVLNLFYMDSVVLNFFLKIRGNTKRKKVNDIVVILHLGSIERFHNRVIDLGESKICSSTVSLNYLEHQKILPSYTS